MTTAKLEQLVDPKVRPDAGSMILDDYDVDSHWHTHDMHQLHYAFEGAVLVEDTLARRFLPNQLAAWIPAGVAHRSSTRRVRAGCVLLAPHLVPEPGERVRIVTVSPFMREMVKAAMRWPLSQPLDPTGEAFFAAFAAFCGEWIQNEATLALPTSTDPAVRAAMEHTRSNLALATAESASRAANLSERSLRRRIKATVGLTWESYRRRARIFASLELLATSKLPMSEIAAAVGFESQSAFGKCFRLLLGSTPQAYRRDHS
jgi:AraC-like DNA-binding protein